MYVYIVYMIEINEQTGPNTGEGQLRVEKNHKNKYCQIFNFGLQENKKIVGLASIALWTY